MEALRRGTPYPQTKEQEVANQVNSILRNILQVERDVEDLKITLAENIRFDTADAFRTIDTNSKGYLTYDDVFRFMTKNSFNVSIKMCKFLVHSVTIGEEQITYQQFLQFMIPRYDREAAQSSIARKLFQESTQRTLTFYLEETVARLLNLEIEYLKELEIKKMRLAQLVEWRFMTVFNLIVPKDSDIYDIDQKLLNKFLLKYNFKTLEDQEFKMFMTRFSKNNEKMIHRDEFSDAIFPSGYLLNYASKSESQNTFEKLVKNQNQELDQYLGRTVLNDMDDDNIVFNPDEHRFSLKKNQAFDAIVVDKNNSSRNYLLQNPQQHTTSFIPPKEAPYNFNQTQQPPYETVRTKSPYQTYSGPKWPGSVVNNIMGGQIDNRSPIKSIGMQNYDQSPETEPPINKISSVISELQKNRGRQAPLQRNLTFDPQQRIPQPQPEYQSSQQDHLSKFLTGGSKAFVSPTTNPNFNQSRAVSQYEQSQVYPTQGIQLHYNKPSMNDSITQSQVQQYAMQRKNYEAFMS